MARIKQPLGFKGLESVTHAIWLYVRMQAQATNQYHFSAVTARVSTVLRSDDAAF